MAPATLCAYLLVAFVLCADSCAHKSAPKTAAEAVGHLELIEAQTAAGALHLPEAEPELLLREANSHNWMVVEVRT